MGGGGHFGSAISGNLGNGGGQSALLEQQETSIGEERLESVELGGARRSSFAILKG